MRKTKVWCDKCKKEKEDKELKEIGGLFSPIRLELCNECLEKLKKWLEVKE